MYADGRVVKRNIPTMDGTYIALESSKRPVMNKISILVQNSTPLFVVSLEEQLRMIGILLYPINLFKLQHHS
jgi:hypothetical protein